MAYVFERLRRCVKGAVDRIDCLNGWFVSLRPCKLVLCVLRACLVLEGTRSTRGCGAVLLLLLLPLLSAPSAKFSRSCVRPTRFPFSWLSWLPFLLLRRVGPGLYCSVSIVGRPAQDETVGVGVLLPFLDDIHARCASWHHRRACVWKGSPRPQRYLFCSPHCTGLQK